MFNTVTLSIIGAVAGIVVLHLLITLARRNKPAPQRPQPCCRVFRRFVYVAWLLVVIVAACTGFTPVFSGEHPAGWMLLIHMVAAGAFTALLLLVPLMWASASPGLLGWVSFWAMTLAALVSLVTMMLSMLPITATEPMHQLILIHRYSGLALVLALAVHAYTLAIART